jgi:MFS superfamily sulfate permease-like transporter
MMPTILITICLSTILNGLAFYLVGYFQFGYILHFFPRHVILGMTFGFGIFLLQTGFQVHCSPSHLTSVSLSISGHHWHRLRCQLLLEYSPHGLEQVTTPLLSRLLL